ncbi:MAG: formate/nitrite transporter family protein [Anaerolineaceae bacterium]|nr:MAG: formate/nitrite transporter family protein [Anaerolineaceae bacterium]
MQNTSGPKALTEYILHLSKDKSNKSFLILILQGILAGIYISIGAIAYFKIAASTADPGLGTFLGALVFPLGIIAVLLMQAELFTSDCMVMTAIYARRTRIYKIFKILGLILIANIIGCLFIAYLTNASGIFNDKVMELVKATAIKKAYMPFGRILISGILCNIIVCTGVCLAYSCQNEMAKIAVLWLAIAVFTISGTEHVVANAYYLFTAYFAGVDIALSDIIYNLLVSGLGNFIGGGIIVSGINYLLAYKDISKN